MDTVLWVHPHLKFCFQFQGKNKYLDIIKKFASIHGTVFIEKQADSTIPDYVQNHGILPGPELHKLLRESKVSIHEYMCANFLHILNDSTTIQVYLPGQKPVYVIYTGL